MTPGGDTMPGESRSLEGRSTGLACWLTVVLALSAVAGQQPPGPQSSTEATRTLAPLLLVPPAELLRADQSVPREDANSRAAHLQLLEKARSGRIDVYFVGDSIVRRWGATDYPNLLANWTANFYGWNAANFGWGADRTEHILWRLQQGELDNVHPKVIVLLAGTNNVGIGPTGESKVADVVRGLKAIRDVCRQKAPGAVLVITGILPRNDRMTLMPDIIRINDDLARLAEGRSVRYLNVNDRLADQEGRLFEGMMNDGLHPTIKAYQIWADALKPILTEILGPPAATDHAPPPTGDPAAATRKEGLPVAPR
jgi:lysophospholipase L1-like esterase